MKDIKKNFFLNNTLLQDQNLYRNFICKPDKLEKIKNTDSEFYKNIM